MSRRWMGVGAVVCGALMAWAGSGMALESTVPPDCVKAMLDANRIVRVRALSDSTFVLRGRRGSRQPQVRTDWRLEVMESWKGPMPPDRRLTLRLHRGKVGDFMVAGDGEPEVIRGEEYVMFLKPDSAAGLWRPLEGQWGCRHAVRAIIDWPPLPGHPTKATVSWFRARVQRMLAGVYEAADSARADSARAGS